MSEQTTSQPRLAWYDREPNLVVHGFWRFLTAVTGALVLKSIFSSDIGHYFQVLRNIGFHNLPYRDFSWEFPPLTAITGLLIPISFDRRLVFFVWFTLLAIAVEVWTMRLTRRLVPEAERARFSWYWLAVFVPLSLIAYFRFDWAAAAFAALAMVGLFAQDRKRTVWGVFASFAVKMWSVAILVPLVARRKFVTAVVSAVACLGLLVVWYLFSPAGFEAFLEYRKGSAFQIESIPGAVVMLISNYEPFFQYGALMVSDQGWQWLQVAMPATFVVGAIASLVITWQRKTNLVAMVGGLVLLLLLTSRLFSPQYMVWLAPFVAVLAVRHWKMFAWFGLASLLTLIEIQCYQSFIDGSRLVAAIVVVRNAILIGVMVQLFRIAWMKQWSDGRYDIESTSDVPSRLMPQRFR